MRVFVVIVAAVFGSAVSCALFAPGRPTRLPDGSYEIKCTASLATCLAGIEKVCAWHGYDVVRASETRRRGDIPEIPTEIVTSEAVVRCGKGNPLFTLPQPAPPPALAVPAPAPPLIASPPPPPPSVPAPDAGVTPSPAGPGSSDGGLV